MTSKVNPRRVNDSCLFFAVRSRSISKIKTYKCPWSCNTPANTPPVLIRKALTLPTHLIFGKQMMGLYLGKG